MVDWWAISILGGLFGVYVVLWGLLLSSEEFPALLALGIRESVQNEELKNKGEFQ